MAYFAAGALTAPLAGAAGFTDGAVPVVVAGFAFFFTLLCFFTTGLGAVVVAGAGLVAARAGAAFGAVPLVCAIAATAVRIDTKIIFFISFLLLSILVSHPYEPIMRFPRGLDDPLPRPLPLASTGDLCSANLHEQFFL